MLMEEGGADHDDTDLEEVCAVDQDYIDRLTIINVKVCKCAGINQQNLIR